MELSDINSDDDKLLNTNSKAKEHDSDEFNIYTMSKGKDRIRKTTVDMFK